MRRLILAAVLVVIILVGSVFLLIAGGSSAAHMTTAASAGTVFTQPQCTGTLTGGGGVTPVGDLDDVQMRNITTIVGVGVELGVPTKGLVVAVATTMQEAGAKVLASRAYPDSLNYPHDGVAAGDHDSVSLFQQRAAWGPMVDRMDPVATSRMFYTGGQGGQRGLLDINGWEDMPIWRAAQSVQVSAFPRAYAKWEDVAVNAVDAVLGGGVVEQVCEAAAPVTTGSWTAPLAEGTYQLTSPFGYRTHPVLGYRRLHTGQDLGAPSGTPIYAASSGTVSKAGDGNGYGNLVIIDHADGVQTYYAHQCPGCIDVAVGQQVTAGQPIGGVGTTGMSTGNHLHFETRRAGEPIDPKPFLTERGVPW